MAGLWWPAVISVAWNIWSPGRLKTGARWVWKDLFPRLQQKGGFLCGPVLDSAQWQEQPSISRVLPPFLSEREKLLLLSCWQQWDPTGVPSTALSRWLVGIDVDYGPDGRSSPTFLKQSFSVQEAADLYQAVHLHTLEDLAENGPYPKIISQLFIFSRLQDICLTSSPATSGLRRSGGMVTPRLLPLSTLKLNGQMPKSYFLNWRTWW